MPPHAVARNGRSRQRESPPSGPKGRLPKTAVSTNGIERSLRTLLRSPNPRATQLLVVALGSNESSLRCGAVRALAMRPDPEASRALVERFHQLAADARAALSDVDHHSPLAKALTPMIRPATPRLARRALEVATAWGLCEALPLAVEAATWPDCQYSAEFAANALSLASKLEREIADFDPRVTGDSDPHRCDPAFARRASVNALSLALSRFAEHHSQTLIDALLLLTPSDEPALRDALREEGHPAHGQVVESLRTSNCRGVLGVLAAALGDPGSPQVLLDIAAARDDPDGLQQIFEKVGVPVGLRVRENCAMISSFAWVGEERCDVLLRLPGKAQATAVEMAAASACDPEDVADTLSAVIEWGDAPGPLVACRAVEKLPPRVAEAPLRHALEGDDPAVLAAAAKLLRPKGYPNAVGLLVRLLDHGDLRVRDTAGKALKELSYVAFRDTVKNLPRDKQRVVGELVGKADPMAAATLRSEIAAGPVSRRLQALELIYLMDLADELAADIAAQLLKDKDIGVRVEAARLLAQAAPIEEVIEALEETSRARESSVASAAASTLALFGNRRQPAAEEASV